MQVITITLKPGRDKAIRQGHPWLFSGAIAKSKGPSDAPVAVVEDAKGRVLGTGLHSERSQIRVRMIGPGPEPIEPDRDFFAARIAEALSLRESVVSNAPERETTGVRLINAEGDGLPGWTVDRFGDVLVSQITSAGLEALSDDAFAALIAAQPAASPEALRFVAVNRIRARRREGIVSDDRWILGEPVEEARFLENGLTFTAEIGGQKTGFYLDQRDNRRLAESLAGDRDVLDLFAHTGAMSAYSLRGGARRVDAVESSPRLIERGQRDIESNALPADRLSFTRANVFEDLRERGERYGLVICDPPSLVEGRGHRDSGARAYKDLNRLAFKRVDSGGFLMTFSCSGAMDTKLFRQVLFAAAGEANVRASLLRPLAAAPDHPVAITHPQGEYLKGWLIHVSGRRGGERGRG